MRAVDRALAIVGGAMALASCNMGDDAGKRERAEARRAPEPAAAAAPAAPQRQPARARLDEIDAAPPVEAARPGEITRSWFAGDWTDSGDCADAGRFAPNGTYLLADGTRGMWNIQDGRLVVQHAGGRSALRLRRVDDGTVEIVNEDGSTGRSTRCG